MDRNPNVTMLTSVLLVLFVVVQCVDCIENMRNISGSNSITNHTKFTQNQVDNVAEKRSPKVLSRRKRYVAFPEGSSFSVG